LKDVSIKTMTLPVLSIDDHVRFLEKAHLEQRPQTLFQLHTER
jgi:hypothetical protein